MRIMVSQMNSVQEPGLIEKTQAWSAMKETVLVSQLNCANVLSRAGEGERKRERERERERGREGEREGKILEQHEIEDRQKAEANKIIRWKCWNSKKGLIENIKAAI